LSALLPPVVRTIVVVAVGALVAAQVVRTALIADPATRYTIAPRLWPSHPTVVTNQTMAEIGAAAARGQTPPAEIMHDVEAIARKAPLAAEPFLIEGALAQVEGRQDDAERLFLAARLRDPRSAAARYFLADRYLRTVRIAPALAEIAALSRLYIEARAQFGPALATFAKMPGGVPQLRRFFRTSPELEPFVLADLARDPRNAGLVLGLWGRRPIDPNAAPPDWQGILVRKLIEQGQYAKAYAAWRQVAGIDRGAGTIFNPGFRKMPAPPPFNWDFSATGGVVESGPGDRLQVIYYGRQDAVLAEQLLMLAPGRYQLGMDISGPLGDGGELAWTLTCVPRPEVFFRLPINHKGRITGKLTVPANCPVQSLRLTALPGPFPQSQEFAIGGLSLIKEPGK
jgi:tetratricopeptide (TPR) repeat protein